MDAKRLGTDVGNIVDAFTLLSQRIILLSKKRNLFHYIVLLYRFQNDQVPPLLPLSSTYRSLRHFLRRLQVSTTLHASGECSEVMRYTFVFYNVIHDSFLVENYSALSNPAVIQKSLQRRTPCCAVLHVVALLCYKYLSPMAEKLDHRCALTQCHMRLRVHC